MTAEKIAGMALSAVLGVVLGWGAQALTLAGRVQALETGQAQIVQRLDKLLTAKGIGDEAAGPR